MHIEQSAFSEADPQVLQDLIVRTVAAGDFVALANEWLPGEIDRTTWAMQIEQRCLDQRSTVEHVTDLRTGVTLIMNTAAMPNLTDIEDAITEIVRQRCAHSAA